MKLEDFCGEVAGLVPVYSNSGSICRIICRSPGFLVPFFTAYIPAFHLLPHLKQDSVTCPLPIKPLSKPTGPNNSPPAAALPSPKPLLPAAN